MYKFDQNPSIPSGERRQTSHFDFPTTETLAWPWKWGQSHQNIISSFACHNNKAVQVWSKSTHSFWRKGADKPFSNNLSTLVTLKMESRSPKSNQFFSMSQQYRCTSLVKIHTFIQEIGCRQAIFQQSKPSCDLEKWGQLIMHPSTPPPTHTHTYTPTPPQIQISLHIHVV